MIKLHEYQAVIRNVQTTDKIVTEYYGKPTQPIPHLNATHINSLIVALINRYQAKYAPGNPHE